MTQRGEELTCTLVKLAGLSDVPPAKSGPLSDGRPDPTDVVPGSDGVQNGSSVSVGGETSAAHLEPAEEDVRKHFFIFHFR